MTNLKVCLILLIGLNFNNIVQAQSCEQLQIEATELHKTGEINKAIEKAELSLKLCQSNYGIESLFYANSLYILATYYEEIANLEKAEGFYINAIDVFKKVLGEEHKTFSYSLNRLAIFYYYIGNYAKAEPLYIKTLEIQKKVLGEEHTDYASSLTNLALLYSSIGDFSKAEPLYMKSLTIYKKILGEVNKNYADYLDIYAEYFINMGNYEKAELLYLQSLSIRKINFGEYHVKYAVSLKNLAALYKHFGFFTKAEPYCIQALTIRKKVQGEDHPDYASSLINLAVLYSDMGFYNKAEPLCVQAVTIRKKVLGEQHPDYATSLNNLGALYSEMCNYSKAEQFYIQVLTIRKKVLGEQHPDYATSLNNLGVLYSDMGHYAKAELLYVQALAIRKMVLGEQHIDYATSLNNLAMSYCDVGNYSKAEPLYFEALSIIKKVLGEKHPSYITIINNLASLYRKIGIYTKAEDLYIQGMTIQKRLYGEEYPQYANTLNGLGNLYSDMGLFIKAESLYIKASEITKKFKGEDHPLYATSLNNLAVLYQQFEYYKRAEPFYVQSVSIRKKVLGEEHADYVSSLINLAQLYRDLGIYEKAEPLYLESVQFLKENWRINFSFLSSLEVTNFLDANLFSLRLPFSFLSSNPSSEIRANMLDFNLFLKNASLTNNDYLETAALKSKDSSIANKWENFKLLRLQISKQLQLPLSEQKNLKELEEQAEVLEKELMRNLPEFQQAVLNNNLTWMDVQSKLKPSEAAIDFVNFQYYDKRWTDTTMYAAFLIRPEWSEPKFVNLFREDQLSSLMTSANDQGLINDLYRKQDSSATANTSLYNIIWQPMDSLLTGVKRLYVSPSGLLHRISLSAVPVPEGGNLNDRYDIHVMGNVRALAEKQTKTNKPPSSSILFGGIDYDNEPMVTITTPPSYDVVTDSTLRSLRGGKWLNLKGTADEVSRIQTITSTNGIKTQVFSKGNASEEAFKLIGNGTSAVPSILHIATHGFAFTTPENRPKNDDRMMMMSTQEDRRSVFRQTTDPLTRAGLVMAGGNKVWSTGQTYPNKEDGILTAREISNMDLRGCVLATLSACETGLGEIKGSEGVFGLQRAFKMAGVENMIVSLWQVPDKATTEFMETFYKKWLTNKLEIRDAFRQTQQEMSLKYKPYQWAAFVLVE